MVFVAAGLLFLVAAQVVAALEFNFPEVQQCAPVRIDFAGPNISAIPDKLWLLPVNSTATSVPLGSASVYSTGISLDFVPFAADTSFIASIDDSRGISVLSTSDVIRVLPSATGNSSCVSVSNDAVPRHFTITSPANQCEPITVKYDNTVVKKAPEVRMYNPKSTTFRLKMISDDPATGTATYMLNFFAGRDILLLMNEGNGIQETSPLITVGGNALDRSCFSSKDATVTSATGPDSTADPDDDIDTTAGDPAVLSKAVIIGSATGGSAVIFIALSMAIFVVQDRKKRLLKESLGSASLIEKGAENEKRGSGISGPPPPRPPPPGLRSFGAGTGTGTGGTGGSTGGSTFGNSIFGNIIVRPPSSAGIPNPFARERDDDAAVMNPPYTSNSLFSTMKSARARGSMASWAQAVPEDQRYAASGMGGQRGGQGQGIGKKNSFGGGGGGLLSPRSPHSPRSPRSPRSPPQTGSRLSLESLDIEGMLNMATLQTEGQYGSRKNSDATVLSRIVLPSPGSTPGGNPNPYQAQYLDQTPNQNQTWGSTNVNANRSPTTTTTTTTNVNPIGLLTVNTPTMPSPTFLRPTPARNRNRNRRSPLDIPMDPTEPESMAFSTTDGIINDSRNPFSPGSPVASPTRAAVVGSPRRAAPPASPLSPFNTSPFNAGPMHITIPSPGLGAGPGTSRSARFLPEPLRTGDSFKIAQATGGGGIPVSPSIVGEGVGMVVDRGSESGSVRGSRGRGASGSGSGSARGSGSGNAARRSSADWYGIAR